MVAPRMTKQELKARLDDPDMLVIDVRRYPAAWKSKIKNAILEDPDSVLAWSERYDDEKTWVIYCAREKERTSAVTAQKLMDRGFRNVFALEGGWNDWVAASYPTETIE